MAEEKKKATATKKKAAPKKKATAKKTEASVKKAAAKSKTVAKNTESTKSKATKKSAAKKTITVTQIGSPIGRKSWQRATLIGLGLNKMHKTNVLEDTDAVRGMINRVKHLVRVEDAA